MKELLTDVEFSLWFGVACAIWTVAWGLWWAVTRRRVGIAAAAAGPVAFLFWLAYSVLAPVLDITRVSGVLVLTVLFAVVGCAFGFCLSRSGAR